MLPPTTSPPVTPWVLGGRPFARPTRPAVLSWSVIVAALALPLPGLFRAPGSFMEEAFMLVFPERLRRGDVPNVDFLHLYGPGSLHVLMLWYELAGTTLTSQRVIGAAQIVLAMLAVMVLCRPTGRWLATVAGLAFLLLMLTPTGLSALAWPGALAAALWSVACAIRALHLDGVARRWWFVGAGALAGFALTYRPDMVLALGMVWVVLVLWKAPVVPVLVGALVGAIPMWIHLAMAGIGPSWQGMFIDPVFELRPGRALPVPPTWGELDGALQALFEDPANAPWWRFPAPSASTQIYAWFWLLLVVNLAVPVALFLARRRRLTDRDRIDPLLAASVFGLGLTGQALQRPDSAHLAWGAAVTFAILAPSLAVLFERRISRAAIGATVVVAVFFVAVFPYFTLRPYLLYSRITVGNAPAGLEIRRGDRWFLTGTGGGVQAASQQAVDELDRLASPGQRLLVGPADLSRTIYSDVLFYHLFPELDPATYFIEMDPGLADAPGSSLADDVASADWLILTNFWTGWFEPNASSDFGSDAPNQVVADRFCLVGNYDNALVLLYRKCAAGDGVSPAGIGVGAQRRADFERERDRRGWESTQR
jgi:hypothetical protein